MITYRELSSLSADLGVSAKALYALSYHRHSHYHRVEIPKALADRGTEKDAKRRINAQFTQKKHPLRRVLFCCKLQFCFRRDCGICRRAGNQKKRSSMS